MKTKTKAATKAKTTKMTVARKTTAAKKRTTKRASTARSKAHNLAISEGMKKHFARKKRAAKRA